VGEAVGDGGAVYVDDDVDVGWEPSLGDVDASAECETNSTVRLVTASAVLANPAIFPRFVIFKAVTPPGLRQKSGARTVRPRPLAPRVTALCCPGALLGGTPGRNAIERKAWYGLDHVVVMGP
jgi:hypothetical protein